MPQLMQEIRVLQASPYHSIVEVTVTLDSNPDGGDVYPESGKLGIAKPGFMQLLSAAGMEEIPEKCTFRMVEDGVYYAKEVIKWTQPDGKDIVLSGDKMMDLRIGGARWQKAHEKALDSELQDWGKKNGMPKRSDETWQHWASRILVTLQMDESQKELLRLMDLTAKQKANRQVRQQAQFGAELAQTGAIERAVKAQLGLKSTYTKAEIDEGFKLYRSEFRWNMIEAALGQDGAKALQKAFIAKQLGVSVDDVLQLEHGQPAIVHPEPSTAGSPGGALFGNGGPGLAEQIETAMNEEEAKLYQTPVQGETANRVRNKMITYHHWRDFDRTYATSVATWVFNGKTYSDLSEGEMQLLATFYTLLQNAKDAGDSAPKRQNQAKFIKEQIDQCVIEQRMWREPTEESKQEELPGMPEKEPDQEGDLVEPGTGADDDKTE